MSTGTQTPEAPKMYRCGPRNAKRFYDTFEEAVTYVREAGGNIERRAGRVYRGISIRELAEMGYTL